MGGPVDGPENGTPPAPWAIPCQPKMLFKDDKIKIEVPHTAKVKVYAPYIWTFIYSLTCIKQAPKW